MCIMVREIVMIQYEPSCNRTSMLMTIYSIQYNVPNDVWWKKWWWYSMNQVSAETWCWWQYYSKQNGVITISGHRNNNNIIWMELLPSISIQCNILNFAPNLQKFSRVHNLLMHLLVCCKKEPAVLLQHLGGKLGPKSVYFVLKNEVLNVSKIAPWAVVTHCDIRQAWCQYHSLIPTGYLLNKNSTIVSIIQYHGDLIFQYKAVSCRFNSV